MLMQAEVFDVVVYGHLFVNEYGYVTDDDGLFWNADLEADALLAGEYLVVKQT